jgi:hypothetical protein
MLGIGGELDAPATTTEARAAAELIRAPRLAFRQFFDDIVEERRLAAPTSFLQAVALSTRGPGGSSVPLDPKKDHDAIALALLALGSRRAIVSVMASAIAAGLADNADVAPAAAQDGRDEKWRLLRDRLGLHAQGLAPSTGDDEAHFVAQRASAEAIIDTSSTWVDPMALHPALLLASRRVCRVIAVIDGVPTLGTGVLIGPSMVLTNWHVVKDLETRIDDPRALTVEFDVMRSGQPSLRPVVFGAKPEWRVAYREMGALEPGDDAAWNNPTTGKREPWWTNREIRKDWAKSVGDKLDFAVIELDGAPGDARGWYDLSSVEPAINAGACFAFHHPGKQPLTLTAGTIPFIVGSPPLRVFHKANTVRGSSGGLVVDDKGLPIALHHAGYESGLSFAEDDSRYAVNAAIPLEAIARTLDRAVLDRIRASRTRRLPRACLDGSRPVFGRGELFAAVGDLTEGRKSVLQIRAPETVIKPGKSFTVEILRALLPPPDDLFVPLTIDNLKASGYDTAAYILDRLVPNASATLVRSGDADTTQDAYYANRLVPALFDALSKNFSGRRVWLVLDELDVTRIGETGGRLFLDNLYRRIKEAPQLRLVLIGLQSLLPSIPADQLVDCPIRADEIGDLPALFERWLAERGLRNRPVDPAATRLMVRALASIAASETPLQTLAELTEKHLARPLAEFLGETSP